MKVYEFLTNYHTI